MIPSKPGELTVTEATRNYVVLSWKPPGERGHEGIMYYVEKVSDMLKNTAIKQLPHGISLIRVQLKVSND